MTSVRTHPIPPAQPGPETAQQADEDRPAVHAVGLVKSYGSTVALAGLDLHVAAGETVALLGPNGAGKTTTIGLLLGLLAPGRGQVRVYGQPPSRAVAAGLVGASRPSSKPMVVVFPAPFGPSSATVSPAATCRSRPARATVDP